MVKVFINWLLVFIALGAVAVPYFWINRYEVYYSKDLGIAGHYRFDRWRQCVEVYSKDTVRSLLERGELTAQYGRCPPSEEEIAVAEAERKAWQIESEKDEQNERIIQAARNILLQRCINAGDTKEVCVKEPQSVATFEELLAWDTEIRRLSDELRRCLEKNTETTCFQKVK